MKESTQVNRLKNFNYQMDSLGRVIMQNTMLSQPVNEDMSIDPFQDLLWNAACSNTSC
jgi:hypothetical protein